MKEVAFVQVEGGYIVKTMDQASGTKVQVTTNFGAATKIAREFLGEKRGKNDVDEPVVVEAN